MNSAVEFFKELAALLEQDAEGEKVAEVAGPPDFGGFVRKIQGVASVIVLQDGSFKFQIQGNQVPLQLGLLLMHNKILAGFMHQSAQAQARAAVVAPLVGLDGQPLASEGASALIIPQ